jgi:putative salt-induced outer membrane protein
VRKSYAVPFLFLLAIPMFGDQITLKNGDRITGSIIKSDGKTVVLKTDYAGEVTVKFDAVQDITTTGDLNVGLTGGKTVVGPVSTIGDNIVVATKAAGKVEAPKASIAVMRSPEEQAAYEKSLHPGLMEGWNGGVNLGFAVTRGNSETKNLNIAFQATRKGFRDKLSLYTNSIYATNDLSTASPHTTANSIGGGARYDRDITPRLFGFVNADFFHNSLQFLDLRSSFGGGLGFHAIKTAATTLDLLGGLNYSHESYSGAPNPTPPPDTIAYTKSYAAAVVGDNFTHKLGKSTELMQSFFFYPDLSNTSDYRWTFNAGTVTKFNKWLGWQNSFGDVYVSSGLRPAGTKANDLTLSTGINISFAH